MADRPAKRPKLADPVPPTAFTFDMLPPDVVVWEILIHITVGFDIYTNEEDQVGPKAKVTGCFGRFCRDPTRHAWAIFRRLNINPATQFLALTQGNVLTGKKLMVLPLRYVAQFTVPLATTERGPNKYGELVVLGVRRTDHLLRTRGKGIDFMQLVGTDDKKIVPSLKMPHLTTVSSLLLGGNKDEMYPNATTILMQGPMDEIPDWCVTLRVQEKGARHFQTEWYQLGSAPWGIEAYMSPQWVHMDTKPIDELDVIGRHSCPNLENVVFKVSRFNDEEKRVVWNMANVPKLRRFVIGGGAWDPQFLLGRGSYYDFLRPLENLDELELRVQIPTDYKKHWFLPPVRRKLMATGFTVPPGYEFPPLSGFTDCQFDPQHTYLLPLGGIEELVIVQGSKYDAPNTVYTDKPWEWESSVLSDLPGRIMIAGKVNVLTYLTTFGMKLPDPDADAVSEEDRQALVELNGLPYEFVFNGSIEHMDIESKVKPQFGKISYPVPNLIVLNGQIKDVTLRRCRDLSLVVNRVDGMIRSTDGGPGLTVTSTERVHSIISTNTNWKIVAPSIDVLICDGGRTYESSLVDVSGTGTVHRAKLINGPHIARFNQVIDLTIESCTATTVWINDLDAVRSITFVNVMAMYIKFIWPDDTPNARIPNHKLKFVNISEWEVTKLRRKLTQI